MQVKRVKFKKFDTSRSRCKSIEEAYKTYGSTNDAWYENYQKQSPDAADFGPYWLEGTQGSLSAERARDFSVQRIRKLEKEYRRLNDRYRISIPEILQNPQLLNIKLSEFGSAHPDVLLNIKIKGLAKVFEGKGRFSRMTSVFIYLTTQEIPEWLFEYLFSETFNRLARLKKFGNPRFNEYLRIYEFYRMLTREQYQEVIKQIYYSSSIVEMRRNAKRYLSSLTLDFCSTSSLKIKIRRRGYAHSAKQSTQSEKERMKSMKEIEFENEQLRQRILNKQLKLFEKNLDTLLQITSDDIPKATKQSLLRSEILDTDQRLQRTDGIDLKILREKE